MPAGLPPLTTQRQLGSAVPAAAAAAAAALGGQPGAAPWPAAGAAAAAAAAARPLVQGPASCSAAPGAHLHDELAALRQHHHRRRVLVAGQAALVRHQAEALDGAKPGQLELGVPGGRVGHLAVVVAALLGSERGESGVSSAAQSAKQAQAGVRSGTARQLQGGGRRPAGSRAAPWARRRASAVAAPGRAGGPRRHRRTPAGTRAGPRRTAATAPAACPCPAPPSWAPQTWRLPGQSCCWGSPRRRCRRCGGPWRTRCCWAPASSRR
jgi:hypothetical protein